MHRLLWIDCAAAALAGIVVITLATPLSALGGLPREVLLFTGVVNLLYAGYSFSLAVRRRRPLALLKLLIAANLAWVPVCVALAVACRRQATAFGFAQLLGEACFVGGLAMLEWRHRDRLLFVRQSPAVSRAN